MTLQSENERDFSLVIISLLKGVMYGEENMGLWQKLLSHQAAVRDYVRVIGLELVIHEDEGFAWLRSAVETGEDERLPGLMVKRQLSYPVSLLLALLRRRLAEHDATSCESRLILDRDEIVEMMRTFLPSGSNEAKIVDQIDSHLKKAIGLGFVRQLKSEITKFEVRRILKAFIDAQWLNDFDRKLKEYISSSSITAAETEVDR
jgi:hypothetical protein